MYSLVVLALALAAPALADHVVKTNNVYPYVAGTTLVKSGSAYPYVADAGLVKQAVYPATYGYAATPAAYGYAAAPSAYVAPAAGYVAPAGYAAALPQYQQYAQYPAGYAYPAAHYGYNSYVHQAPVQVPASTFPAYSSQYVVPKTVAAGSQYVQL